MTDEWKRLSDVVPELGQRCEVRYGEPFEQDAPKIAVWDRRAIGDPKMLEHPMLAGAWMPEILGFHCDEGLVCYAASDTYWRAAC